MAIEKETWFKIIKKVSESEDLKEENLLKKIRNESSGIKAFGINNNLTINKIFAINGQSGPVNCTLLHLAVECENAKVVECLLKNGIKVDEPICELDGAKSKLTALHIAASHGHQEIVQLLLDAKANPLLKNSEGQTPREVVGDMQNMDTIIGILKKGEQEYNGISDCGENNSTKSFKKNLSFFQENSTPTHLKGTKQPLSNSRKHIEQPTYNQEQHSTQVSDNERVINILENDINKQDEHVYTILLHAIKDSDTEQVKDLIERGANVNAQDKDGRTPLHFAAFSDIEIVKCLIEKGKAEVNAQDKDEWTPLHFAAFSDIEIVKYLIEKGKAEVNAQNKDGRTPLHLAASSDIEIVKYLIEKGKAEVNAQDKDGRTPLCYALKYIDCNYIKIVKYLIEIGASTPDSNTGMDKHEVLQLMQSEVASSHSKTSNTTEAQEKDRKLRDKLKKSRTQLKKKQEENESLKQKIQDLENKNTTLKDELEKNNNQRSNYSSEQEAKLEALRKQNQEESESSKQKIENLEKELEESKSRVAGSETRLEELSKLNEENESLKQKIQELKNENTTLRDELDKNKNQHSKINEGWTCLHSYAVLIDFKIARTALELGIDPDAQDKDGWTLLHYAACGGHLDRVKYLVEEGANFEIKNKKGKSPLDLAASKQNNKVVEFLQEKIKSKTGLNEGELEKTEKRQFLPRVAYAGLAAMLAVGATLSIASGLSILLIIAASVTSALIAGGVTYAVSKPTTTLKEVVVQDQQHGVCKT